ncbi:glycosyltransferase [Sphingomonas ginkgonis]|uniref:Glycosyltransferase n=1 Tax=Sphingomonas ginkgonis TaxID=2315330 RepID=A0A429V8B1_9SPHN|nr:glycosyltransferase [Sphingomonas ginkgonis]RST30179.1 glycosyltransferase [Sphingomonas ginkgonis]
MRISLLVTELSMGGAARVVRDHAEAFAHFAEVREVVFNRADGVDYAGGQVTSLDVTGGGSPRRRVAGFFERATRYRAFKREWRCDISVSHLEGAQYVDLLSRGRAKRVAVVHGSILGNEDISGALGTIRRHLLLPLALRSADAVVAVSRDIARELRTMGVRHPRVINNFFDLERIRALAAEPLAEVEAGIFGSVPVIVTSGRMAEQKNQAPLLAILADLRQRQPCRLLILGDGPRRGAFLDQVAASGLSLSSPWTGLDPAADVHCLGFVENPFKLIAASDLFAFPSAWEGFPLALCEAMACGTAVVSSDCPTGPREILAPTNAEPTQPIRAAEWSDHGILMPIPAKDRQPTLDAWVDTLGQLLADAGRRETLAARGLQRVHDFSRDAIVPQWEELFRDLLRK